MSIEIKPEYKKFCLISEAGDCVKEFVCPVEGCSYTTDQGPGTLRMHLMINADPKSGPRYSKTHEEYLKSHPNELTVEAVRYLAQFKKLET